MPPKRKNNNNQHSEEAGQVKRARKAPIPETIKWPEAPSDSKGFRSIVQTTTRRTAEELGLPPGVPAPILAIPSAPGVPSRPNCKIVLPDLVLPTGVRPPWEEHTAPRYPPSSVQTSPKSRHKSTPALAPGAGFSSMPHVKRTTSTASLSTQVASSSKLFTPRPSSAQSDKVPPTKTKAVPPHSFLTRAPKPFPSFQPPLPETAKPPTPQPAPASQILQPAQNSPILDHELTLPLIDSSHNSSPGRVPPTPVPLRRQEIMISPAPLGAASPSPPVSQMVHSPPQPKPGKASPQPNPLFGAASPQRPPESMPLRPEETMSRPTFSTQCPPPVSQTAHNFPQPDPAPAARPLLTQGQVSSQAPTRPIRSLQQRPIPIPMPTHMPIPIPTQSVQPNNRGRQWGSRQPNARGPLYPPSQQQQQYDGMHSNKYHPARAPYPGGYRLNQQTHNPYTPGAPSSAAPIHSNPPHSAYPAPAHEEYNPYQPSFTRNGYGAGPARNQRWA